MPPSIPELIDGKYRVLQKLGRGGMGAVYLVRESGSTNLFALKVLHEESLQSPSAVARFQAEMTLPAKIGSENIVHVVASGTAAELDGAPYLVMELLRGCDLGRVLETFGRRSGGEVLWILHGVAQALDKAHAAGVVHRDLKPENIFLHLAAPNRLTVKLLDFGIARITEDARQSIAVKRAGATTTAIGTPLYMAPEQAQGPSANVAPVGPATDIWALGMIVYELLTGETYWRSDDGNALRILGQIVFTPQLEPPSRRSMAIRKGLDPWFLRSCAHEAKDRWPSAGEQIAALVQALGASSIPLSAPKELITAVEKLMPQLPKEAFEQTLFLKDSEIAEEPLLAELRTGMQLGILDGQTLPDSSVITVPFIKRPDPAEIGISTYKNTKAASLPLTPQQDRRHSVDGLDVLRGIEVFDNSGQRLADQKTNDISGASTLRRFRFLNVKIPWSDLGLVGWFYAIWKTPAYRRNALLGLILLFAGIAIFMIVAAPRPPVQSPADPVDAALPDLGTSQTRDAGTSPSAPTSPSGKGVHGKPTSPDPKVKNSVVGSPKKPDKKPSKRPVLELPKD